MSIMELEKQELRTAASRPRLLISGLDSLYVGYFLDMATGALDWDELAYQGRPYKSLSAIARAITGTRWNGWTFFGLRKSGTGR